MLMLSALSFEYQLIEHMFVGVLIFYYFWNMKIVLQLVVLLNIGNHLCCFKTSNGVKVFTFNLNKNVHPTPPKIWNYWYNFCLALEILKNEVYYKKCLDKKATHNFSFNFFFFGQFVNF